MPQLKHRAAAGHGPETLHCVATASMWAAHTFKSVWAAPGRIGHWIFTRAWMPKVKVRKSGRQHVALPESGCRLSNWLPQPAHAGRWSRLAKWSAWGNGRNSGYQDSSTSLRTRRTVPRTRLSICSGPQPAPTHRLTVLWGYDAQPTPHMWRPVNWKESCTW